MTLRGQFVSVHSPFPSNLRSAFLPFLLHDGFPYTESLLQKNILLSDVQIFLVKHYKLDHFQCQHICQDLSQC